MNMSIVIIIIHVMAPPDVDWDLAWHDGWTYAVVYICVYIYIYIYIYIAMCIYIHLSLSLYIYIYMYVHDLPANGNEPYL